MTASRLLLMAAGVLVVGLVLGLIFALRGDRGPHAISSVQPSVGEATPPPSASAPPTPVKSLTPHPPTTTLGGPPTTMRPPDPTAPAGPAAARDHRGDGPTGPSSVIVPATMIVARQAILPAVQACGQAVSPVPEAKVRYFVHSTFHVASGVVTAGQIEIDGADALGADYVNCVRRAFESLSAQVPTGQPDGDELEHLPFVAP